MDNEKKAILAVSFGTSYAQTRKITIEACEDSISEEFPEYEVKRAFTSGMIIRKLKERDGLTIDTPAEALKKLYDEGYTTVYIQSLHIINGDEYNKLLEQVKVYENRFNCLKMGKPLLTSIQDYKDTVKAVMNHIKRTFNDKEALVLMGHGSEHCSNSAYPCLDYIFKSEGYKNVFVGTVEGFPEIDTIIPQLREKNIEKVTLMPFMIVAGDHAQNDMAGEDEDSWNKLLQKKGFDVEIFMHGIGESKEIQKIFINHLKEVIN